MSMISEQISKLKNTADAYKFENPALFKLLSEAAETISDLSAKVYRANMERSDNYYKQIADEERVE